MNGFNSQIFEKAGFVLLLDPRTSGVFFRAACNTTSILYPAYASFKAIEAGPASGQQRQWLSYWSFIGLISLVEGKADDVLRELPYYYHVKLGFLVWLQMQGAQYLYTRYVQPSVLRFGPKVDVVLANMYSYTAALYTIYKIPIDSAVALAKAAVAQTHEFGKWFSNSPPNDKNITQLIRN
eukprot:gene14631-20665_t